MNKFFLDLLVQIVGIGSASGLFYKDNSIYVISDNSAYLYEYKMDDKALNKTLLFEENENLVFENIPKNLKPDFEALCSYGDDLYLFGSGSTANRTNLIHYNRKSNAVVSSTDLSDLYAVLQSFSSIDPKDFNIEGAVFTGETWYLFQRGNGGTGKNGVFTIEGASLETNYSVLYKNFKLPKIKGVEATFTDAIKVDNKLYFLATVEDTKSTYDDGAILGSFIGAIDIDKMKIDFTQKITSEHKFEGLTLYKNEKGKKEFLLCEDNDTDAQNSSIYKLTLQK
ncbi:DUF6929 family protein [Flavobacterium sp. '19STA2R22 D10 B1']|uniref:DUF6929 family protein n=1 Tax=Flavobacterium aerium TaxID=3037261 RepID=UPI00278BF0A7|nr:hypothetical protein [Flavobacterium sp. '19STA2R22 D10 B1']